MAVASIHTLHSIINGATIVGQLENVRATPGVSLLIGENAGRVAQTFAGAQFLRPEITFDTPNLYEVLNLTDQGMADLSAAVTYLYFSAVDEFAERESGNLHTRLGAQTAGLIVNQIRAGHRDPARASCRLVIPYDGTNKPLIPAGTLALGGTTIGSNFYLAGPVSINATPLLGVQNITVDFGITLYEVGGEGEMYDTFVAVQSRRPVVTVQCLALPWTTFLPAGVAGLPLTGAGLVFYFRKLDQTGPFADNTANHVKFAATTGLVTIDDTGGGGNDAAITTVRITPTSVTGGAVFIITKAIAIT